MSYKDYIDLEQQEFLTMKKTKLKQAVKSLRTVALRRYNALKKREWETPAVKGIERAFGKTKPFSNPENMDLNTLRSEYMKYRNFIEAQTSTISGANKWVSSVIRGIKNKYNSETEKEGIEPIKDTFIPPSKLTAAERANWIKDFWGAFNKVKELQGGEYATIGYSKVLTIVREQYAISGNFDEGEIKAEVSKRYFETL